LAAHVSQPGDPGLFYYPFWKGVGLALWYPSNSIFLFDPLLTVTCVLLAAFWRRIPRVMRCYSLGAIASLAVYILFYATYQSPTGEASWGDRYVTTPVLLLALLAVPLTLRLFGRVPVWAWLVMSWSLILQLSSLALIMSVELIQSALAHLHASISMRLLNMWLVWSGQAADSDLLSQLPLEWRTWNFLPFQMTIRYPELARWAIAGWWALGALWVAHAARLVRRLGREE
jgi:hypothetical protein